MFIKTLNVDVIASTFKKKQVPAILGGSGTVSIDVMASMLTLGSVTTPGGFSQASPARFWAWIRYFAAFCPSGDIRITMPFADLDPHQKTILSDDFGVALTTSWLGNRLGGFVDIVDGRRFLIQYASLVHLPPQRTRKVGPAKCPDYVALDKQGKWHVLECKGTQSGHEYLRDKQMGKTAVQQKGGIKVKGSMKGESLVIGVSLEHELSDEPSRMRVIDPPAEPLIELDESHTEEAEIASQRLATSRALGLAGFHRAAEEVALPAVRERSVARLYRPGEAQRVSRPREDRRKEAKEELSAPSQAQFVDRGIRFLGREIEVEMPGEAFRANTGGRERVYVRQGVNEEIVARVRESPAELLNTVDAVVGRMDRRKGIEVERDEHRATLRDGQLFSATVEFR